MAAPLEEREASLSRPDGGDCRVALVADTHSRPHPELLTRVAALRPDAIVHAGDVGEPSVLRELAELAPVHAVRGNIDPRSADLPDLLTLDVRGGGRTVRLLVVHIAQRGPRLLADVAAAARARGASLVVCGHSHVPFLGRDGDVTVFNPGSAGPRRFRLPIVFGALEVGAAGVRLAHVDCETGLPWRPPGSGDPAAAP